MKSISAEMFLSLAPPQFYHAHGGSVDTYSEMNLSFECGCGKEHNVKECMAIVHTAVTNKAVYLCPIDDKIFNLIGVKGILRIKGLKNLAYYKALGAADAAFVLGELESRKRRD
jgi:hypothetical protein